MPDEKSRWRLPKSARELALERVAPPVHRQVQALLRTVAAVDRVGNAIPFPESADATARRDVDRTIGSSAQYVRGAELVSGDAHLHPGRKKS